MPHVHANGIDIAYESFGRVTDPVLLLIHGLATPRTGWPDSLCAGLVRRGFRVVRFDNRDIGRSTVFTQLGIPDIGAMMATLQSGGEPRPPYPLDAMAADAAGLMDALAIPRAHIAGASMGGMIAQLVALNHPEKTESLISIMSSTGRPRLPPAKPEAMRALLAMPASPGRADRLATAVAAVKAISGHGFPQTDEELAAYLGRSIDATPYDPPAAARHMAAVIAAAPRHERLNGLDLPALVIHGSDDPIRPPAHGEDTANSIPGAELLVVPGMGHDFKEALMPVWVEAIGDFAEKAEARKMV
jgi:pimeloyl-ACP methyl ester carboxylesterase